MSSNTVHRGQFVSFTHVIKDITGQILELSEVPTSYVHGRFTEIFPQVVKALEGKLVGDKVTVPVKALEAFGPHDEGLTFSDDLENAPPELRRVGAQMDMQSEKGDIKTFRVSKIEDGRITLDSNHVLAGKDLIFAVTVTEVRPPNVTELANLPPPTFDD
ncbi:MAG: FKBP-type peptidyl-prolyl cis-trans isomerase SlyD [Saprospiraceae bacterium]